MPILVPYFPAALLAHGLYLEELYVAAEALLWATDEENTGAQRFYDRLGMKRIKKLYYVMDA